VLTLPLIYSITMYFLIEFHFFVFLGITLKGRYVPWLAVARPSGLPPYGRHHSTALMRFLPKDQDH